MSLLNILATLGPNLLSSFSQDDAFAFLTITFDDEAGTRDGR